MKQTTELRAIEEDLARARLMIAFAAHRAKIDAMSHAEYQAFKEARRIRLESQP